MKLISYAVLYLEVIDIVCVYSAHQT